MLLNSNKIHEGVKSPNYSKVISEYFDLSDKVTRQALININEADQNKVLVNLTSKLYEHIVNKIDDIDFGEIPKTKGDLEALPQYPRLKEAVTTVEGLLIEYKQSTVSIDVIKNAINNIISLRDTFKTAFAANVEMPMVIYNTIVLSIISSTSFLISGCVEYIKIPNSEEFDIILDKVAYVKSRENLLLNNLAKFNNSCNSGEMKKALDHIIKGNAKGIMGVDTLLVMNVVIIITIALSILPMLRELIYFYYFARVKISDYFDIQSELLQANTLNIQNNDSIDKAKKSKIITQQKKIADFFKKVSNTFAVKLNTSSTKTTTTIKEEEKKYKIDEVVDTLPDTQQSSLF